MKRKKIDYISGTETAYTMNEQEELEYEAYGKLVYMMKRTFRSYQTNIRKER